MNLASKHRERPQITPPTGDRPWLILPPANVQNRATVEHLTPEQQDQHAAEVRLSPTRLAKLDAGMIKRTGMATRGTKRTKIKLRPDTLVTMVKRGTLGREHLLAAAEIRDIFVALTLPMGHKTIRNAARIGSPAPPPYPAPLDRLPPKLLDLYHSRYKPWAEDVGQRRMMIPGGRMPHLDVVISVVVDGESLSAMVERLRITEPSGCHLFSEVLRHALARYCQIGGIG